jgi:hypothetical protein
MNLWERLDRWYASAPRPSVAAWDELIDDLYRAQQALFGEYISLGSFDLRHPVEDVDRLFVACERWGWFQ